MARAALLHGLSKPKAKAWTKDVVEQIYLDSVNSSEAYVRLERELNKLFPPECLPADLDELLMPLCQECWGICEKNFVMAECGSLYQAAREEAQHLQQKLKECTLKAMKQITALQAPYQHEEYLGDETIQFFEPLKYVDEVTRELVWLITADKVKQIANGTLPNDQMQCILDALAKNSSGRRNGAAEDADNEELEDLMERIHEAEREKRTAQEQQRETVQRLRDSEMRAAQFQQQCDELRRQAEALQQEALVQQANLMAEAEQARESLRAAEERLEEAEKAQAEVLRLQEVCAEAEAKASALSEELQSEREASAGLQEELRRQAEATEEIRRKEAEAAANVEAARKKAEEAQAALTVLQARTSQFEQEALALRAELAELRRRVGNGTSQGAQTTLTSSEVDSMEDENRRLKVALEELRAKLGDLMNECKKKGIAAQMDVIADTVGLKPLMKARSIFQKLYEDAELRVARMEKLRQKYAADRGSMRREDEKAWRVTQQVFHSPAKEPRAVMEALQHSCIIDDLPQPPLPAEPSSPPRRAHGLCSPSVGFASMMALASNSTAAAAAPVATVAPFTEQRSLLRDLVQRDLVQSSGHSPDESACGLRPAMAQAVRQPLAAEEGAVSATPATSAGLMFPPTWVAFKSALSGRPAHEAGHPAAQQAPPAPASPAPALPAETHATGGELARRLAASTSLPTLGHATPANGLRCPGGAMPRHPAGYARDSGWR